MLPSSHVVIAALVAEMTAARVLKKRSAPAGTTASASSLARESLRPLSAVPVT
jgi:hypothetical protein